MGKRKRLPKTILTSARMLTEFSPPSENQQPPTKSRRKQTLNSNNVKNIGACVIYLDPDDPDVKKEQLIKEAEKVAIEEAQAEAEVDVKLENPPQTILRPRRYKKGKRDETIYTCDECGEQCQGKHFLRKHKQDHKGIDRKQIECPYCTKKFAFPAHAEEHINTHTGNKPYQCDMCDYASSAGSGLRQHLKKQHLFEITSVRSLADYKSSTDSSRANFLEEDDDDDDESINLEDVDEDEIEDFDDEDEDYDQEPPSPDTKINYDEYDCFV